VAEPVEALRTQITRQVAHWSMAARRLEDLESLASPNAWLGLERYLGLSVRRSLLSAIERLQQSGAALVAALNVAKTSDDLARVRNDLVVFRRQYLRTETTVDFYADAVNTRTTPRIAALLRACDVLAGRSLALVLDSLGKKTPPVLSYLDKGLGASILKAGLRLWDGGTENPAAMIKIARHNLFLPTSLIHETGHQMAHILGWNEELSSALLKGLSGQHRLFDQMWAGWASEIAADAFAFVHTGYAAVAALHDVIAGDRTYVFRYIEGDPHPVTYLRVLLGAQMCASFFGGGPWDELAWSWKQNHPLADANQEVRPLLQRSLPLLPDIVTICLQNPMQAFGGRSLAAVITPVDVSPQALFEMERQKGAALFSSPHWIWSEPLRLLALAGYRAAVSPATAPQILRQQETWMFRLGSLVETS